MTRVLMYLGIVRDPSADPVVLPLWVLFLIGVAAAALAGVVIDALR